jgi:ribosomal-protein-alanine N-acetyltransferase
VRELRRLSLADVAAIERIERRSYPTPWSRTMFAGELGKPTSRCYGCFDDGILVAYLIVACYVDAWHVMNVAVDPVARRQGVARMLLEQLFDETREDSRGYTLEVRVSNAEAIRLYERLGFVATGVRRGYYTDNREDALIMWREPAPALARESEAEAAAKRPS